MASYGAVRSSLEEAGGLSSVGVALVAKSYCAQFIIHLETACSIACPGCVNSENEHTVCQNTIPDQLYHLTDVLPHLIDEQAVDATLNGFISALKLTRINLSPLLFDKPVRRRWLHLSSFCQLISTYCLLNPIPLPKVRHGRGMDVSPHGSHLS